ncbi:hypothetical protein ABNF97_33515 [Plantactinospora sp. B6F1]|uniref:hypothetical protein n=1 Tax=Plantactinospora sp. B6F1 TaxID=3158971 RepID=UPI0032D930D7
MNIGDVKVTVRRGVQAIGAGRRTIETVAADTADATSRAGYTVYDSRHPEVEKAMASLREAAREVELTTRRIDASVEEANEFLRALG